MYGGCVLSDHGLLPKDESKGRPKRALPRLVFVVALKRAVLNVLSGSAKCRFKIFLKFPFFYKFVILPGC